MICEISKLNSHNKNSGWLASQSVGRVECAGDIYESGNKVGSMGRIQ